MYLMDENIIKNDKITKNTCKTHISKLVGEQYWLFSMKMTDKVKILLKNHKINL